MERVYFEVTAINLTYETHEFSDELKFIRENKRKLYELMGGANETTIPRHILGGITITKSIKIVDPLDKLINDYSREKNITRKEIIQIALIDFFRRYGYSDEVRAYLKI